MTAARGDNFSRKGVLRRSLTYYWDVAKLILDPKVLPDRTVPIPGAKPPVVSFPFQDLGRPEEVDSFRRFIRDLRQNRDSKTA
jgi:hypothetical protein